MKLLWCISVSLLSSIIGYSQPFDTLRVFFPLNKTELTEESNRFIDSLVKSKILERNKKISLLGYGDYLGSDEYNNNLSYLRAKNIQDYLVLSGFNKQDVILCTGKGKINKPPVNGKGGNPTDRKVDIIIKSKIDTPAEEKFNHYLLRLDGNDTYPLKNIQFYQGSLTMMPGSMPELKMLYRFLLKNKTVKIQLEGHVCCLGPIEGRDEPYDESTLSQKRAEGIADSMVVYGIDRSRMKCIGLGNNNRIIDEETGLEIEALTRRVEVRIISR